MKKNKINHNQGRKRTLSRLIAIQILYQYNFFETQAAISEITENVVNNYALTAEEEPSSYREKIDIDFLYNLVNGVTPLLDKIDVDISELLQKNWTLQKLPDVMLEIIRFAVFELKFITEVPLKVVVNEYVNIASSFYDAKKVTFVNSILENLARKYRATEFQEIKVCENAQSQS
jgi:N utilization substance protein B